MFEETVYQPQQVLDVDAGRKAFEANCASCHKFGSVGTDHGVAGLNLSASPLRASKHALLEAVFFPERKLAPEHETTVIETTDGKTISGLVLKEAGATVSLLTAGGHADRRAEGADQVAPQGEDVDHAGLAGGHDRPQHDAQPGGVPGGDATGG